MTSRCLTIEQLDRAGAWPDDDPRRLHIDNCPRCRALLASYRAFVEPSDAPPGADPAAAKRALAATLAHVIMRDPGSAPRFEALRGRVDARGRWARWWDGPILRPALALAAGIMLTIGALELADLREPSAPDGVLRGEPGAESAVVINATLEFDSAGTAHIRWDPLSIADAYRVVVFDATLQKVTDWEVGSATALAVDLRTDTRFSPRQGPLFWAVVASQNGDEIARSRLENLPQR
jgi:hypothetical protein